MTDFSLELDGFDSLSETLTRLEEEAKGDAVWTVGTNTEYAIYLEMGTRYMPPYPFFRPAIREFEADPEGFIIANTAYSSIEEIPTANAIVEAVASGLERQMKTNVSAPSSGRSPGTNPEHPMVDTGNLRASIQAVRIR